MDKRDFREAMLIVGAGLLGAVMSKALDLSWNMKLIPAMILLLTASVIVFFLAKWLISFLPR
jgi:hypothetical protein